MLATDRANCAASTQGVGTSWALPVGAKPEAKKVVATAANVRQEVFQSIGLPRLVYLDGC
jgi:hypothetical protein